MKCTDAINYIDYSIEMQNVLAGNMILCLILIAVNITNLSGRPLPRPDGSELGGILPLAALDGSSLPVGAMAGLPPASTGLPSSGLVDFSSVQGLGGGFFLPAAGGAVGPAPGAAAAGAAAAAATNPANAATIFAAAGLVHPSGNYNGIMGTLGGSANIAALMPHTFGPSFLAVQQNPMAVAGLLSGLGGILDGIFAGITHGLLGFGNGNSPMGLALFFYLIFLPIITFSHILFQNKNRSLVFIPLR